MDNTVVIDVFHLLGGLFIIAGLILDVILLIRLRRKPMNSLDLVTRLQSRPWTWKEGGTILMILAVLYGFLLFSVTAARHLHLAAENEILFISLFVHTLLFPCAGLIVIISLMRLQKVSWRTAFGLNPCDFLKNMRLGIIFYIAAMPVLTFYTMIYMKLLEYLHYSIERQDTIKLLSDPYQPVWLQACLVMLAIIMAPFVEELLFRGIALPLVSKHLRISPAVCLVSILFALMHFHIPSLVPLFIIAFAFSLGYLYSGSILVPIVMHALFNGVSIAALLLLRNMPGFAP